MAGCPVDHVTVPQRHVVLSADLDQSDADRVFAKGWGRGWVDDDGMAAMGELMLYLAGQQHRTAFLNPLDVSQMCDSYINSWPKYAAAAMQGGLSRTVGLLNVWTPGTTNLEASGKKPNHWVFMGSVRADDGSVSLSFYDSCLGSGDIYTFSGAVSTASSSKFSHLRTKGVTSSIHNWQPQEWDISGYPAATVQQLHIVAAWHCSAWGCAEGAQVTVSIIGTGQQVEDGWMCGRWAVANMGAWLNNSDEPQLLKSGDVAYALGKWLMVAATEPGLLPAGSKNYTRCKSGAFRQAV